MEDRDRDEAGRFDKEYSDEDILEAVENYEPAATTEVANELGIARQSADYRLQQLNDQGLVSVKKVGGVLVWSLPHQSETS